MAKAAAVTPRAYRLDPDGSSPLLRDEGTYRAVRIIPPRRLHANARCPAALRQQRLSAG